MNTIMKVGAVACGLIAVGCASRMTALNSELPPTNKDNLKGDYVLERIKTSVEGLDAVSVSEAISVASKDIFKGSKENKQSLPVTISVERDKADGNGGIASVNNLFAFCTLTIWPWVSADEYTYKVKARSVVGEHEVSFKLIDRCWGGLSPFAIIPVPGWADERGDESELVKFHLDQIAAGAKAACASLPNDYQSFLKDQSKYLEQIDQERSEGAFASFMATKKATALDGLTNEVVKKSHQNELVAAFKDSDSAEVKAAILKKLNDDSFQKLPYDPVLCSYWGKIENNRVLAFIYRDSFSSLADADRSALANKIHDDKVIEEMVVKPSREVEEKERRDLEEKKDKLVRQMEDAKRSAESAEDSARRYKKDWQFGLAKDAEKEAARHKQTYAKCAQGLAILKKSTSKRLYVEDANARKLLYWKIKNPETVIAVFGTEDVAKESGKSDRQTLNGAYGSETVDLRPEAAQKYLVQLKNQDALIALAHGAKLFSIRAAAIARVENENELAKIARGEIKDCPYDTSLAGYNLFGNGIEWISKTQDASKANLQRLAIARMNDAKCLRDVRKECKSEIIKQAVTARLSEIGQSDVAEICAYDKYDSDLFSMVAGLKDKTDIQKVSQSAKLKGIRILVGSKLDTNTFAALSKKEAEGTSGKPVEGKLVVAGYYLGMNIEDAFAKLAAEHPDVKPTIYLDDGVLCIAGSSGRDIAWASAKSLDVHWLTLPPSIVKQVAGFKTGSFEDLERAVERKLGISFGYDVIRKGSVSQKIGNFENTEGETLRYFISEIGEGEDFGRSVRKAVNQHTIDTNPLNGGFGAALANAFEDAQQADENRANARRPMFQPQGSLQVLLTKNAAKGSLGSKGSIVKGASLGAAFQAASELGQKMDELKGAKKELGKVWSGMKSEVKKGMNEAMGDGIKDLKKSMDELDAAADALKNLGN